MKDNQNQSKIKARARARAEEIARQCAQENDFYEFHDFVAAHQFYLEEECGGHWEFIEWLCGLVPSKHAIPLNAGLTAFVF